MSDENIGDVGQELPAGGGAEAEVASPPPAEVASLMDQLADIRQEIKEEAKPLYLAVPGYSDRLWGKFRPFSIAKTESKAAAVAKAAKRKQPIALAASCDTIIEACEEVMVLHERFGGDIGPDGENLIHINEVVPVRFDKVLAELLKVPGVERITNARQVIKALFPTEQSILRYAVTINEWLNGELSEEADEEFVGNSPGTSS